MVILEMYRGHLLNDLHREHHGICRMKSLARGYLWWPGLDVPISQRVSACHVCASINKTPHKVPLHTWKWLAKPWERIHMTSLRKTS